MKAFQELVVVELAGSLAGAYAGKLFSDYGAQVVKVEPRGGDPARLRGESWRGIGTEFAYLNTGKQSLVLDVTQAKGWDTLGTLLAGADVVVESSSPEPLEPVTAGIDCAGLTKVFISPFGLNGPYSHYKSTPFTDYASGGHMYLNGEPHREPIQGAGAQPLYAAGAHAFIGAMAALRAREATGRGQLVEVSHMETMASLHQWTTVRYSHGGKIQRRVGNKYDTMHPITIYPCKDGHVAISAPAEEQCRNLLVVAELTDLIEEERFSNGALRLQNGEAFDEALLPWLLAHTAEEIVSICQAVRVPVGPVPTMLGLLEDAHLADRNFWRRVADDEPLLFPGPPFRLSAHEWNLTRPPRLGEHDREVLARLKDPPPTGAVSQPAPERGVRSDRKRSLEGVRILDLSRVWAGPLATRILGDLGADVIRVEAPWARSPRTIPDVIVKASARYPGNEAGAKPWNREGMFNKFNRSKRAITLDLGSPDGKALFERLVAVADVVIENYSPRVMPQLGLGYERLREVNPSIVYIGMPGFGWTGPNRDYVALGTMLEPAAGLSSLMGYADSGPYKSGVAWADPVAAMHAAAAILIALHDREADPDRRGQAIELAQLEGMICFVGEEILAAQVRGTNPPRLANRDPLYAPQGCYRCSGEDRWIAVSVTNDRDWRALCDVAGFTPRWRSFSLPDRQEHHDELDALITTWTQREEQLQLMRRLQAARVPAVAVLDSKQLLEDPHLRQRQFFVDITHPDAGTFPFPGLPIRLSETPAAYVRPAPGVGEHNVEVLQGLLGLSPEEMADFRARGIIADEPPY